MDASTGFFHEHTIGEGKRYRLKNRVFSLLRASRTVTRSRFSRHLRKPLCLNPDRIRYCVQQYRQHRYQKTTIADRCLDLLERSGNQHSQNKNFIFNAV
ncbi:hypothetical protein [Microcoleus asticus]|uniref:hypothetical protein n=1 Tax=Microcoleus asticus TaxID=2815231 RepID=UPI001C130F08|nr:hypothetical protein [Microcoleus asticus]